MSRLGMDADAVEAVAHQMQATSRQLDGVIRSIDATVNHTLNAWQGPVTAQFHQDWMTNRRPPLMGAATDIDEFVKMLMKNVQDQRATSSDYQHSSTQGGGASLRSGRVDWWRPAEVVTTSLGAASAFYLAHAIDSWGKVSSHAPAILKNVEKSVSEIESATGKVYKDVSRPNFRNLAPVSRRAISDLQWAKRLDPPLPRAPHIGVLGLVGIAEDVHQISSAKTNWQLAEAVGRSAVDVGCFIPGPVGLVCMGVSVGISVGEMVAPT